MIIRFENSGSHDGWCQAGSSTSSMLAALAAAIAADPSVDGESVTVRMLGPIVILEGYLSAKAHRATVFRIAEQIAGQGRVQDRMLCRHHAN